MSKILLVEDETTLARQVSDWLKREKYLVEIVHTGQEALASLHAYDYDIVLLDWMLPGISGVEICKNYRAKGGRAAILMLTARSAEEDKETGLDSGADDYLAKPFGLRELSARIRALLRRSSGVPGQVLTIGAIQLDPTARRVSKNGREIHLEPREFSLLEFFMRNHNQVFDADTIISRVWDCESLISPDSVRGYIKTLRKKFDSDGGSSIISTIKGSGYRFEG